MYARMGSPTGCTLTSPPLNRTHNRLAVSTLESQVSLGTCLHDAPQLRTLMSEGDYQTFKVWLLSGDCLHYGARTTSSVSIRQGKRRQRLKRTERLTCDAHRSRLLLCTGQGTAAAGADQRVPRLPGKTAARLKAAVDRRPCPRGMSRHRALLHSADPAFLRVDVCLSAFLSPADPLCGAHHFCSY